MRGHDPGVRSGPLPAVVGIPLSCLYRVAMGRINRRFDRGRGVVTFDRPVISVGNLSVGGTGKTPMVRSIVRWLLEAGHRPCIAMRGYGARQGTESDEAAAYERAIPGVPVVAQSNRTLGLIQLFAREHEDGGLHSDCIVLDDGFQHRQIARSLDIVLVDASRDPFRDRLLPGGWLREPVMSLGRAGAVVITHAESVSAADVTALDQRIAAVRGGMPAEAACRHVWVDLAVRKQGQDDVLSVSWLAGKRVLAVCAIGNPKPFVASAERTAGGALAGSMVLQDHDPYSPSTVRRIVAAATESRAHVIVTTDKDWSKLRRVRESDWPCPVARPQLDMRFDGGEDTLRAMVLEAARRIEDEPVQGQGTASV
jgi:tetraacyldisaccharide 4'-kinase